MSRRTYARPELIVEHTLPECPVCRGHDLRTVRTATSDETGVIQSKECRECGQKFTTHGFYLSQHCQDLAVRSGDSSRT